MKFILALVVDFLQISNPSFDLINIFLLIFMLNFITLYF